MKLPNLSTLSLKVFIIQFQLITADFSFLKRTNILLLSKNLQNRTRPMIYGNLETNQFIYGESDLGFFHQQSLDDLRVFENFMPVHYEYGPFSRDRMNGMRVPNTVLV